nr:50S ribosomal protein L20 [Mycoplasmopsis cricetuli]
MNAATRMHGMSYSQFINGLKKANVTINRKMLSELAINEQETFKMLIELAKN